MAFNMSRVALGFAGGALSGYDTMLKAKMQEEYEQKREEALYNRQKNLMEQQAKINQAWETDPNNPDTQVKKQNILASQAGTRDQDRRFALQEKEYQTNTQFKSAELGLRQQALSIEASRTAALNAASAASARSSNLQSDLIQLKIDAEKDPEKAVETVAVAYGKLLAKSGKTQEQIDAGVNKVRESGINSFDKLVEIHTGGKEIFKEAQRVSAKAIENRQEDLKGKTPKEIIAEWNTIAPKDQQTVNPAEAEANLLKTSGQAAYVAFLGSTGLSDTPKSKDTDKVENQAEKESWKIQQVANEVSRIAAIPPNKRTEEEKKTYSGGLKWADNLPKAQSDLFYEYVETPGPVEGVVGALKNTRFYRNYEEQKRRQDELDKRRKENLTPNATRNRSILKNEQQ